ncbi:MAG: iron chaperone [Microbacteriaceae bacterium]
MSDAFSKEEKAAMRAAAAEARKKFTPEQHAAEVIDKYATMAPTDREIGEAIHRIVMSVDPALEPKTWYGMPAYYKNGKVICFFQDGGKFKSRYCTFGFQQDAALDDGDFWPTSFAVTAMTPAVEKLIRELVALSVR